EEIIQGLNANGVWQGEVQSIRKDGTTFWCNKNVTTYEHSQYGKVWISINRDITERKRAEEKLRESEQFIRRILDTVDECFIVIDRDFRIVTANMAYCRQYGVAFDDVIGRHCYEI